MRQLSFAAFLFPFVGFVVLAVDGPAAYGESQAAGAASHDGLYRQELVFEFADEDAARNARFQVTPLFNGHRRAVSCRWDDNWTSDNEGTRQVMEEHGIRGTWYLNGRRFTPVGGNEDYVPVAKRLLEGGNSVGGHSLTHPYLTYFHSNRMFTEMAGVRIDWEAALDRPVVSYAYSFVDLRPEPEGRRVLERTLDTLDRAGYYHISEYLSFFDDVDLKLELSPILPPENSPFDVFRKALGWANTDPRVGRECPMVCNSMHGWYGTNRVEFGYDELRRRFKAMAALDDVWHCNQNEYAAYRRQHRYAELSAPSVNGKRVAVQLTRPSLLSVNDRVPLSISVQGATSDEVQRASCASADVTRSDRDDAAASVFHVHQDRQQTLPQTIGWIANPTNDSAGMEVDAEGDFPWLSGRLVADASGLILQIRNDSADPIEDCRVTWRTPLGWRTEQQRETVATIGPNQERRLSASIPTPPNDAATLGDAMLVAEVDFVHRGEQGRMFFTCTRTGAEPDNSWPLDQFSVLGPLDNATFNRAEFVAQVEAGRTPPTWSSRGGELRWRPAARDGYVRHDWMSPEYVRTMGTWDAHSDTYVLRSKVTSPEDRSVKLIVSHAEQSEVLLNGKRVESGVATLAAGENWLVIIYPGATMSPQTPRLTACYVRLADPETGERLTDLRYSAY
ncbi:MAG: polysaccharide deacetylase family protein [Planctomycetota bacterium]